MSEILERICKTIKKHNMLKSGEGVLVALSGGADSVCLLRALNILKKEFNIKIYAAHLNHMLRGEEADNDENFAKNLCVALNIPFYSRKIDVAKYAVENSLTSEEAGRNLRYQFFSDIVIENNISKIATAHNANDNVETVFMRFIRGTGIAGLAGIPYVNNNIIRPLLDVSREEIENFMAENNYEYVTDSTNKQDVFFRNKIRLNLLPEIEKQYNPNFKKTLSQNIEGYNYAADFLGQTIENKAKHLIHKESTYCYIIIENLKKEHDFVKFGVIRFILEKMKFNKQVTFRSVKDILAIVDKESGSIEFSKDFFIYVIYGKVFFVKRKKILPFEYSVENFSRTVMEECNREINFKIIDKQEKQADCIYLDYEKVVSKKIVVRNRRNGDFFFPSGMSGKKKLKDFFIDLKIPHFLRDEIPIITADDEIVCISNLRESEKYKVTKDTKKFLKIEIKLWG